MAEYYALLARAIGAQERNDESSRREIYVKARSALIRQLKAITPTLPPAEISKQRLALEEAIRRVEREAVEAASSQLSEEEITRRAEQALEEALAPGGGSDGPSEFGGDALRMPPHQSRSFEPAEPVEAEFEPIDPPPPPPPQPRPAAAFRAAPPPPEPPRRPLREEAFAEPVPPRPRGASPQGAAGWERGAPVTDVEETRTKSRRELRAEKRRGGRGWERTPKPHGRRSFVGFVAGLALVVIVLGVAGYFIWDAYGDRVTEFFGGEVAEEAGNEEIAEVVAAIDGEPGEGVEIVEPPPFVETIGYLYSEPTAGSPLSERYQASVDWEFLTGEDGQDTVVATVAVPDHGLTIGVRFLQSADPIYSHEVIALVEQAPRFQNDPIAEISSLAIKTSEESVGVALQGDVVAEPDAFLLALPQSNVILNTNRIMQSPWFDLSIIYESGRRVIVAFNKGTAGDEIFAQAAEVWDQ
jgi:hypothetical protein